MNIYPAIDLKAGRVVQLVGGDPQRVAVAPDEGPAQQANKWMEAGARWLHVIDLDAALGGQNQWRHLSRIIATGAKVQFGGGIRHMTDIQKLLDLGVARVVVGTQGVRHPEWTRELCKVFPSKVVLAVDARGRDVQTHGWTQGTGFDVVELVRSLDDAGLAGFLFTHVEREGKMEGADLTIVRDLRDAAAKTPLIISGGIRDDADLAALAKERVDGVVLGMSIYTGRIDLQKAIEAHEVMA